MLETSIEKMVTERAEKAGWFVRKLSWVGRRSAPDRLFVKEGRVVFIEFKAPKKGVVAGQGKELARLLGAGAEAYCCDNPISALKALGIDYA